MARTILSLLVPALLLSLSACQVPPERLPPELPESIGPRPYAELLTRARSQAKVATEAFYLDRWGDIEDAARGLEQTARYLSSAEEAPVKHRSVLVTMSKELN